MTNKPVRFQCNLAAKSWPGSAASTFDSGHAREPVLLQASTNKQNFCSFVDATFDPSPDPAILLQKQYSLAIVLRSPSTSYHKRLMRISLRLDWSIDPRLYCNRCHILLTFRQWFCVLSTTVFPSWIAFTQPHHDHDQAETLLPSMNLRRLAHATKRARSYSFSSIVPFPHLLNLSSLSFEIHMLLMS
jgi:hypothetical protein